MQLDNSSNGQRPNIDIVITIIDRCFLFKISRAKTPQSRQSEKFSLNWNNGQSSRQSSRLSTQMIKHSNPWVGPDVFFFVFFCFCLLLRSDDVRRILSEYGRPPISLSMTLETGAPTFLKARTSHDVNSPARVYHL